MQFGNYQKGKDIDVLFAYNDETAQYYELQEQYPDGNSFPIRWDDFRTAKIYIEQFIDNDLPDDELLTIVTKNGTRINTYTTVKDFKAALRPFTENHFAFIIYVDYAGYEYYWFNGWKGLLMLQEYTNWFDMDIYYDWI